VLDCLPDLGEDPMSLGIYLLESPFKLRKRLAFASCHRYSPAD
jgi:hypothetical protein